MAKAAIAPKVRYIKRGGGKAAKKGRSSAASSKARFESSLNKGSMGALVAGYAVGKSKKDKKTMLPYSKKLGKKGSWGLGAYGVALWTKSPYAAGAAHYLLGSAAEEWGEEGEESADGDETGDVETD